MNAVVLAAGFSTRLYPLTQSFPKGLLEVGQKPIISQIVDQIVTNSKIKQTILITNSIYFPHFRKYLEGNKLTEKINLVNDGSTNPENRLGAIGDLLKVLADTRWNENLLVVSSDTLTSLNLDHFIRYFEEKQSSITALYSVPDKEIIRNKLGCAVVDEDQQITRFVEKPTDPPSNLACVPYYLFNKKDLSLIRAYNQTKLSLDSPGSLLSYLHTHIPVYAYIIPKSGYYYDVGTPETLSQLQKDDKMAP